MKEIKKEMLKKQKKERGLKHFICENTNILKKELLSIFQKKSCHNNQNKKKGKEKEENIAHHNGSIYKTENINKIHKIKENEDEEYILFLRYIYSDLSSFIEQTKIGTLQNSDFYDVERIMTDICNDIYKKTFKNIKEVFDYNEKGKTKKKGTSLKSKTEMGTNEHDFIIIDSEEQVKVEEDEEDEEDEDEEDEEDEEEEDEEDEEDEEEKVKREENEEEKEKEKIKVKGEDDKDKEKNCNEFDQSDTFFFIPPLEYIVSYVNKLNIKDMQQFIKNNDCENENYRNDSLNKEKINSAVKNVKKEKDKEQKKEENKEESFSIIYTFNKNKKIFDCTDENASQNFIEEYKHQKDIYDSYENDKTVMFSSEWHHTSFDEIEKKEKQKNMSDNDENKFDETVNEKSCSSSVEAINSICSAQYSSDSSYIKNYASKSEYINDKYYKYDKTCDVENEITKETSEKQKFIEKCIHMSYEQNTKKEFLKDNDMQKYNSKLENNNNRFIHEMKYNVKKEIKQKKKTKTSDQESNIELKTKQNNNDYDENNNSSYTYHMEQLKEQLDIENEKMELIKDIETDKETYTEELNKEKNNDQQQEQKKEQRTQAWEEQQQTKNKINGQESVSTRNQTNISNDIIKTSPKTNIEFDKNMYKEKLQNALNNKKIFKEETTDKNKFQKNENLHDDYYYFKYLNESENKMDPYLFTKVEAKKKIQVTPSAFPQFLRDIQIFDVSPKKIRLKKTNIVVKSKAEHKNTCEERKKNPKNKGEAKSFFKNRQTGNKKEA